MQNVKNGLARNDVLNHTKTLSGHPDLNREPPAPKAGALPLEPCPECVYCSNFRRFSEQKNKRYTRPKKERQKKAKPAHRARVYRYCAHQDLNLEPTDYESVALTD